MKAVLTTNILVSRVALFAEMAWMVKRPELGILCREALDEGNGTRIVETTVQSVMSGLSDAGARNVIAWCHMLRLCDASGGLTALGVDVAERDEAPVPEQGVYDLWIGQHSLFGRRVLSVDRLSSTRDQRFELIRPLEFEPDRGQLFSSVVNKGERFMVRDLPTNQEKNGGISKNTRATCHLRWTLDFERSCDHWQLDGKIEGSQDQGLVDIQHEPESEGLDLWQLASTLCSDLFATFGTWQASERRLAVSFESLSNAEIDSFRKTLTVPRVKIPRKGSYDNVIFEDVPIGPRSKEDAQQWAMARFEQRLADKPKFYSRAKLREVFIGLTENTPLEDIGPMLPSHDDLLEQATKDLDQFWSIAAPVDLSPGSVTSDELGTLCIGKPSSNTNPEGAGILRIPYRGDWSMRRLIDQLLAGFVPAKVLLCDRYVRGRDNLNTLKLLVSAFHEAVPSVEVYVWTLDQKENLKKIKAITDTQPLSYGDIFGRNIPHDRYLLVLPQEGTGFGWQMSNSPLHARIDQTEVTPDTSLRWKDLMASRVTVDELEPELQEWLYGGKL